MLMTRRPWRIHRRSIGEMEERPKVVEARIEVMKDETIVQMKRRQDLDHRNRTSLLSSNSRSIEEQTAWLLSDNEWVLMDRVAMMTMLIHRECNTMDSSDAISTWSKRCLVAMVKDSSWARWWWFFGERSMSVRNVCVVGTERSISLFISQLAFSSKMRGERESERERKEKTWSNLLFKLCREAIVVR